MESLGLHIARRQGRRAEQIWLRRKLGSKKLNGDPGLSDIEP